MGPLWSARQAAQELHVGEHTARRRAARAFQAGDTRVQRLSTGWYAPETWWRELFVEPVRRGRPPGRSESGAPPAYERPEQETDE